MQAAQSSGWSLCSKELQLLEVDTPPRRVVLVERSIVIHQARVQNMDLRAMTSRSVLFLA